MYDEDYGFEISEEEQLLIENKDWPALVEMRREIAKQSPEDLYSWQRYAEALNLNGMHQEAIEAIEPFYRENHDLSFGVAEIIDALFGMGKTEDDFDWVEKPEVVKLNDETVSYCVKTLRRLSKPVNLYQLYENQLSRGEYLSFQIREFAEYLQEKEPSITIAGDLEKPLDATIGII